MPNEESGAASNAPEITVSELSANLKRTVEEAYGYVRVRGEVSNYKGPHSSGHAYFCLKDETARLDAVIWKMTFARLKIRPEEGMEVIATGKITTYAGKSSYQIVIDHIEPAGAGALLAQLEERRKRLAAEGLFAPERKRRIPFLPNVIGVVTSPTGAVIRDILHRLSDRFPRHVLVWPVRVQGETSAAEVTAAIQGFNTGGPFPRPDVLIVARGGGSLEDLWGFNDEALVRAVAASRIPIISAVGHETDTTLIDFAADLRAPTPTGAAEFAVPVRTELLANVGTCGARLVGALGRYVERRRTELRSTARALSTPDTLLATPRQKFDALSARLGPALIANERTKRIAFSQTAARIQKNVLTARIERCNERLTALSERKARALRTYFGGVQRRVIHASGLLRAYSYEGVLERGFALVMRPDGALIRSASGISPGDELRLKFHDGDAGAVATGSSAPAKPKAKPGKTKQDDLFG